MRVINEISCKIYICKKKRIIPSLYQRDLESKFDVAKVKQYICLMRNILGRDSHVGGHGVREKHC